MIPERWHKKDVKLTWNARQTPFAVAQELFSSHDVDAGSRLLLRSLDLATFAGEGQALDYGCGYGVLGLAFRTQMPGWDVTLVDRDALAAGFSRWNAERLGLDGGQTRCRVGLGVDQGPDSGWNLVLWNVPGKAGEQVLAGLTRDVAASLADGGVVALVIVNPLAALIRESLTADSAIAIVHDEQYADHTVIHARHDGEGGDPGDPFDRGLFDREPVEFGVDEFEYTLTPVQGLPDYDEYSYASQLVFDLLHTVGETGTVIVQNPGQGHVPLVIAHRLRPHRLLLIDRDQLALRASIRAIAGSGPRVRRLEIAATPDLAELPPGPAWDLAILMLEDQVRNEIQVARLDDLAGLVKPGGSVVVAGGSTMVSRFLGFAAKSGIWKVRDRVKRSGAAAARMERMQPR